MVHKQKINPVKKLLWIFLIGIILFNVGSTVWNVRGKYLSTHYWKEFPALEKVFLSSQYVNKHPKGWIPDEVAFSYSAGKLIKGTSPVLVVPDAPPLGKYLIGLSALLLNNENIIVLASGILALYLIFLVANQVFKNKTLALIPAALFSSETIFKSQIEITPLLDLFQLVFILAAFYFFNKGLSSKRHLLFFLIASILLGFFMSTKFFITGIVVIATWYAVLLLHKDIKRLISLTLTVPVSVLVLLLSYSRVLFLGYSIRELIGIQKWVYLYHKSFLILPLSVWPLLLANMWFVWFGDKPVISDSEWIITWPIITVLSFATMVLYVLKKIPKAINIETFMVWVLLYLVFLSFGQVFSRYFIIVIPFMYIISLYGIVSVYKIYKK